MTTDRTRSDVPNTPALVLVCDRCRAPIDDLEGGMFGWSVDSAMVAEQLTLGHKRCIGRIPALGWWSELTAFADPMVALQRLASMAAEYRWTVTQLQRLVDFTWAITRAASAAQREGSVHTYVETAGLRTPL